MYNRNFLFLHNYPWRINDVISANRNYNRIVNKRKLFLFFLILTSRACFVLGSVSFSTIGKPGEISNILDRHFLWPAQSCPIGYCWLLMCNHEECMKYTVNSWNRYTTARRDQIKKRESGLSENLILHTHTNTHILSRSADWFLRVVIINTLMNLNYSSIVVFVFLS